MAQKAGFEADEAMHCFDHRGLIKDALALEGLAVEEYRAIFFDWAFGLKDVAADKAARALLAHHKPPQGHPIRALLEEAADNSAAGARAARRRGGARGRR